MKIRNIKIRNFRGIKTLDWALPDKSIFCLIGKGDSAKTTILEAIRYAFYPSWNLTVGDYDFYDCQTYDPLTKTYNSIIIEIILGDLIAEFYSLEKYGGLLHGWNKETLTLTDEPDDNLEEVLVIRLKISGEDLEPTWEVLDQTLDNGIQFKQNDRIKANANFIGNHTDRHLTWGKGSILTQLTESDNISALFNEASRSAKNSLNDQREDKLKSFDDAARKAEIVAKNIGVPVITKYIAQLDLNTMTINQGGLSLHDGEIPLRQLGLGSRRMLICGIQKEVVGQMHITLIDEIEIGLEPHRITRLLKHIASDLSGQYFITTHCPTVLRELTINELYMVHNHAGEMDVISASKSNLKDIQGKIRSFAEAFLARKVIVCEGATEVGFSRGLDNHWVATGLLPFSYQGIAILDSGGSSKILNIANGFKSLFYDVVVIADGDRPVDFSEQSAQELRAKGVEVVRWSNDTTLEERVMMDLPWKYVLESVKLAKNEFDRPVIDNIRSQKVDVIDENIDSWTESIDFRKAIGKAAKTKNGKVDRCWFKDISRAERWMEVIAPTLADETLKDTELIKEINKIRKWADYG